MMNDDLKFVRVHVPDYQAYGDESSRHDSDDRVRAYVGVRLAAAHDRLAGTLDEPTQKMLEEALMRCEFADQVFVRKFEHARLDHTMVAAFVRSDRHLIELAETFARATAASLGEAVVELDKLFEYRRGPEPVAETA